MKSVLVLTRFRGEYEPRRLKEEGQNLGYSMEIVNYEKIRLEKKGETVRFDLGTDKELLDYDLIIPRASSARGKSSSLKTKSVIIEYLASRGKIKTVLNGKSFLKYPLLGKLEQGLMLKKIGLPVVDFENFEAKNWSHYLKKKHQFPMILKMRFGSHGKNVRLVESEEKLEKLAKKFNTGTVLIQPVIKVRRWYRAIYLGGKIIGLMKHRQKDKYQTEILREETKLIKPSFTDEQMERLKNICMKACLEFDCDFAGLDVAWDENNKDWVIWEVNRTAQFKWFEKAHPEINIAKEILTWIEKE